MWLLLFLMLAASVAVREIVDVHSSTARLAQVLNTEIEVVTLLENYIKQTELEIDRIRKYVDQFKLLGPKSNVNLLENIVSNPLYAYKLMKRLTIDWGQLEKTHQSTTWQDVLSKIYNIRKNILMPIEKDLEGAAAALIRLHETYMLNASDLAKGDMLGIQSSVKLTAWDCLYIGKHSFYDGFLDLAVEWFHEAIYLASIEKNITAGIDEIMPFYEDAIQAHDEAIAQETNSFYTFEEIINGKAPIELKNDSQRTDNLEPDMAYQDEDFRALCRGEKLMSLKAEKFLLCYLSTQDDPYFILHPLKVEEHHLDPPIYTFHDIISDNEIEQIKELSIPHLVRSHVGNDKGAHEVSKYRTSQASLIKDDQINDDTDFLGKIVARVGWITQLNVIGRFNSERFKIINYGIGGHFDPHHDYFYENKTFEQLNKINLTEPYSGDRIATFMIYLTDVTRGGATAFPLLGTTIVPKKGAAAFWYNLRPSGQQDVRTLHGGCPVLYGSKWLAIKWFRELNQPFRRPCGLIPEE